MALTPGQIYADKYRIVRLLGEGAMGAVYEAENTRIRRRVAIKVLHPQIARKADTLLRFEREAQAAGRIGSQHIVEVLDLGELPDGSRFMVLEYLDGTTLDQRIRSRGRLTPEEATPIVCQLLEGLGAAHRAEIIHRDLKPANVYLCPRPSGVDFVKILDFGVSKFNVLNDEMSMTSTGAVLGTPYYMSPEQAKGSRQIDSRSDLYAVGVILYECITGQVPFSAETFNELIFRIVLESPPPVESFVPNLDPAFTAIIHKAMAREAGNRFQTAEEFRSILLYWGERAAAGPVVLGAIGAGGTQLMDPASPRGPELDLDNARTIAIEGRDRVSVPPWTPGSAAALGPLPAPRPPPKTQALPQHALPQQVLPQQSEGLEAAAPAQLLGLAPASNGYPVGNGYPASPGYPVGNGYPAAAPVEAPLVPEQVYAASKQRNGAVAFVGGLLAVLVIGGGVVALVKWKSDRAPTPIAATASAMETAAAVAVAPAPPPLETAAAEPAPTSAPVAAGAAPEPASAGARSGAAARQPTTAAAPKSSAKAQAGPTAPTPSGKRTVSNEL